MKRLLCAAVAALGLSLGVAPNTAEAGWEYRTVRRWDPCTGCYVYVTERIWVPDCGPGYGPYGPIYRDTGYRYYPPRHHHHHHHDYPYGR